jgi:hypothetical protein
VAGNPLGADEPRPSDSVILVADGPSWKFDHQTPELAAEALDALVVAPPDGYRRTLATHVVPHRGVPAVIFDNAAGSADVETRRLTGFARGVIVRSERRLGTYIDVLLYQFDDEEGARTYAERLAGHLGDRRDPDAPRPPVELPYSGIEVCGLDTPGCTLQPLELVTTLLEAQAANL